MGLKRRRQESPSSSVAKVSDHDEALSDCRVACGNRHDSAASSMPVLFLVVSWLARPGDAFVGTQPAAWPSSQRQRTPNRSLLRSSLTLDRPVVGQPPTTDDWDKQQFQGVLPPVLPGHDRYDTIERALLGNQNAPDRSCCLEEKIGQTTTTAITKDPSAAHSPATTTLKLWKRRLVTRQDWKHMHKITGVLFLLSSWGLTAYGIRDLMAHGWTQPVTSHGTPFLALLLVLLASSVVQSFSSFHLACKHRRGQPAVRNTFLCNAAVAILGSVSALWSSAWYPACLNGAFSLAFYFIMDGVGLIGMGDNLVRLKALIASRQTTNKHSAESTTSRMSRVQYWKDAFIYMMPILIGAPFFVAIGWQFGIQHDRTFYLNLLQRPGHPHLEAGAVYGMVMVAMGASYSSLIVTLRDKKLIRKRTEGLSLAAIMVCLIGSLYQALHDPGTIAMIMGM